MLASSSKDTPPGRGPKVGKAGVAEWQVTQRAVTMLRTTAKGTGGPAADIPCAPGGAMSAATATSAAAPGTAAHTRRGPWPIMTWRAHNPAAKRSSATSQLHGPLEVAGKCGLSMRKSTGKVM